jgi:glycosyltransferase involved in cell wall biosynthesis
VEPTRRIVVDALQVAREYSGVGRQVLAIGAALHDLPAGVELELRCAADAAPALAAAFPEGTRVVTPIARSHPRLRRIAAQQLRFPLRDGADTLLVCLGDQAPLFGRARILLAVNDVRRLLSPEGTGPLERLWYRTLVPRAVRRAASVVTISAFSRAQVLAATGRAATVVAQHPEPRPLRGPAEGPLLVVGSLRPHKSPGTVVEALALLTEEERRTAVFAGPEEGRAAGLRAHAVRRGVADWVDVRGWVGEDELDRLYAGAWAVVCPSRYEGYGLPVAESLARGIPTVASAIPAHLELVGETGARTFPAGDAAALAEVLRALAPEEERTALAAAGHARMATLRDGAPGWRDAVLSARTD